MTLETTLVSRVLLSSGGTARAVGLPDSLWMHRQPLRGSVLDFISYFLSSTGLVKIKLELTTLPRYRVECQFNL